MLKKKYLPVVALGAVMGSYAALSGEQPLAVAASDEAPSAEVSAVVSDTVAVDSVAPSMAELKGEAASQLYKSVKFMLYEGELESNIYPAALAAVHSAVEALELAETSAQRERAAGILLDLDPLMAQGAVFYSQQGDQHRQSEFARTCIDVRIHPMMTDSGFENLESLMPQLLYSAAYGASADGNTEDAKKYLKLYLESGDTAYRQNVVKYYGQACLATQDYAEGLRVLSEGTECYPTDMQMLMLALQTCLDGGLTDRMQPLLDKALALNPNDEKLLNLQARLYERNGEYGAAVDILNRLIETHSDSLDLHRSLATCYYNLGASHYNSSVMEDDEKVATRHRRQSKIYFGSACSALGQVLANTPSDMKFLTALAHTYASLGEKEKFEETNRQIRAFGGAPVAFNSMPSMLGDSNNSAKGDGAGQDRGDIPSFDEFAAPYITAELGEWARRGEFETVEEYRRRMVGGDAERKYDTLLKQAEKDYLDRYASRLLLTDMKLNPYDVEHETYRIDTPYGETVIKVPLKGKEAEAFKAGWEAAQLRAPRYMIRDGKVALASVTYVVGGRKYVYSAADAADYSTPHVYVDMQAILGYNDDDGTSSGMLDGIFKDSDVDINIPVTSRKAAGAFALVIANEVYDKADNVYGAMHDGATFSKYCVSTLGIPQSNLIVVSNATGNQVRDALSSLVRKVKGYGPEAEVIVYYAGHGLPDESNGEAYMMPVDANPLLVSTLIPMKEIYSSLGDLETAATSVFVDACFSGTDRTGEMINKARGVVYATRPATPEGNMFVLTAASSKETALPYTEKYHGLFTYWLLKKLQESKGNATLRQIAEYVISNVRRTAESVNGKPQNPTVSTSGRMAAEWDKKKLKP